MLEKALFWRDWPSKMEVIRGSTHLYRDPQASRFRPACPARRFDLGKVWVGSQTHQTKVWKPITISLKTGPPVHEK